MIYFVCVNFTRQHPVWDRVRYKNPFVFLRQLVRTHYLVLLFILAEKFFLPVDFEPLTCDCPNPCRETRCRVSSCGSSRWRRRIVWIYVVCPEKCLYIRKALDNIDLNLVSHRYVSGVLKDDHFVSARSLSRSSLLIHRPEDCFSHKTVNI